VHGAMFWLLCTESYPDYDGFSVYHLPSKIVEGRAAWIPDDSDAVSAVLKRWSRRIKLNGLNAGVQQKI